MFFSLYSSVYSVFFRLKRSLIQEFNWLRLFLTPGVSVSRGVRVSAGCLVRVTDGGSVYLGRSVFLSKNVKIIAQGGVVNIGDDSFVGDSSIITAKESIVIGKKSLIAERVTIRDQDHNIYGREGVPISDSGFNVEPILIENDVWLCAGSVITKGVSVGEGAVVGANSVATKNVEPRTIVGGIPAKRIRER
ncbi:acyltransferase [Alcanivorax profundi]|uniref:Acyltransferase n=1 Tax=Alcanivorax profundi TaxID=2338368 RepID=A0A418XX49_9GAMM|nr:acyltransferase [Alcanivorax profundi]RJG17416.1 acyltransferase [Alcanivorax profundi]